MESLLRFMLVHYYQDSKRSTNARITRAVDVKIAALCKGNLKLSTLVGDCKKASDAAKRKARTDSRKLPKKRTIYGNPGVQHIPCRERHGK